MIINLKNEVGKCECPILSYLFNNHFLICYDTVYYESIG